MTFQKRPHTTAWADGDKRGQETDISIGVLLNILTLALDKSLILLRLSFHICKNETVALIRCANVLPMSQCACTWIFLCFIGLRFSRRKASEGRGGLES